MNQGEEDQKPGADVQKGLPKTLGNSICFEIRASDFEFFLGMLSQRPPSGKKRVD
jgi:hypothetical protein